MHGAKVGGREGYRERVREIKGNRERDGEWEKEKYGPSIRGRVGLTLKLDNLLGPSMTFEVILIKMKYLSIYNISIHLNFYQNRFINESVRKNFLKFLERQT